MAYDDSLSLSLSLSLLVKTSYSVKLVLDNSQGVVVKLSLSDAIDRTKQQAQIDNSVD
ncbi:hypothetical protein [Pseudoalteromonas luteoviolacea]|uniref:hypothetical protein n=1 Tax=Pseudoalteromonas luteoviolacea TaxID=43657 RepID=UPI000AE8A10B|nr:hypothetical protein [Pseudoalteromonas luteoviolacea]